jgi:hypothetical protein
MTRSRVTYRGREYDRNAAGALALAGLLDALTIIDSPTGPPDLAQHCRDEAHLIVAQLPEWMARDIREAAEQLAGLVTRVHGPMRGIDE